MICWFVSDNRARLGIKFNATTPEPRKGSIQSASCFSTHLMLLNMKGTSFVLMPWHLIGGTPTCPVRNGILVMTVLQTPYSYSQSMSPISYKAEIEDRRREPYLELDSISSNRRRSVL